MERDETLAYAVMVLIVALVLNNIFWMKLKR